MGKGRLDGKKDIGFNCTYNKTANILRLSPLQANRHKAVDEILKEGTGVNWDKRHVVGFGSKACFLVKCVAPCVYSQASCCCCRWDGSKVGFAIRLGANGFCIRRFSWVGLVDATRSRLWLPKVGKRNGIGVDAMVEEAPTRTVPPRLDLCGVGVARRWKFLCYEGVWSPEAIADWT